jgi:hypothetical protein
MSKLYHNRSITTGDRLINNVGLEPENKWVKKAKRRQRRKLKKKIKETYAVYGSIEEIRRIRMENQLKKGWVKAPTT